MYQPRLIPSGKYILVYQRQQGNTNMIFKHQLQSSFQAKSSGVKNNTIFTEKTGLLSSYSVLIIPAQEKLIIKCVASILVSFNPQKTYLTILVLISINILLEIVLKDFQYISPFIGISTFLELDECF